MRTKEMLNDVGSKGWLQSHFHSAPFNRVAKYLQHLALLKQC